MAGLNKAQAKAAEATTGNILVLAGPGTGKTRVIISKVEHLLSNGFLPEEILAVTFSRKATQEMEDRLSEVSASLAQRMTVSTLHGLCAELVEQHAFRLGFQKKPKLISEAEAFVLFRKLSSRLPIHSLLKTASIDPVIEDLLNLFADCKDEGVWPESLIRYAESLPEGTEDELQVKTEWRTLGDLYNAYQSYCFENGLMDFGDSILCALRLLDDFAIVREESQKRYRAILIDEFQDTNWSQIRLLRLLAGPDAHVMAVGDDDQSIYRFRGASYSAFKFFEEFFPNAEVIDLNETYRLPPSVLEVASTLIAANGEHRFRPDKKLISKKADSLPVRWIKASTFEDEAASVCEEIQKLLDSGVPPKDIGILARAHLHGELILSEAKKRGLPVSNPARKRIFQEPVIRDLFALLKLCIDPTDSVAFLRLLDSEFLQISAGEIYALCRWKNSKSPMIDYLSEITASPISPETQQKLSAFYLLYQEAFASAASKRPSEILLMFYEKLPVIRALLSKDRTSLKTLGQFHSQLVAWEHSQGENSLRSLYPVIESVRDHEVAFDPQSVAEASDQMISMLTIHASKGLEFDYVFIPSLVGRRVPSSFQRTTWMLPDALRKEAAPTKESHIEEERRLLYVAMTRARKQLTLTSVEKKGTKASFFITEDLKDVLRKPSVVQIVERPPAAEDSSSQLDSTPFSRISPPAKPPAKGKHGLSLSFTQLEKYETCPLSYQFKYDLMIPAAIPSQMHLGSAVHRALELFFQKIKKEEPVGKAELLEFFERAFKDVRSENPDLPEVYLTQGKERLSIYYDSHGGKFPFPHAIEEDFVLPLGPHKIRGKIDRIDKTNAGFRIVDYKTGKAKSNDEPEDIRFAKDSLQFSIYALAAAEVLKLEVTDLVFDYVYECKTLSTTRTAEDLRAVKGKIEQIASDIQDEKFVAKPGNHCRYCEYRSICPSAK